MNDEQKIVIHSAIVDMLNRYYSLKDFIDKFELYDTLTEADQQLINDLSLTITKYMDIIQESKK